MRGAVVLAVGHPRRRHTWGDHPTGRERPVEGTHAHPVYGRVHVSTAANVSCANWLREALSGNYWKYSIFRLGDIHLA